jgi:BirA family transcriptional regulator, biotin operon repressor / biotin---[acetyl-CoA-carboxylase] ligase
LSHSSLSRHLDADAVRTHLAALAPAFDLVVVSRCASTNTCLVEAPPLDDGRIHVLAADLQTAGRGRRGRQWLSWEGASLNFSAMWRFAPTAPVPAGLSLVAGIAVAAVLEKLGIVGVQLKWPNDILVHGAKVAGILVELVPGRGRTPAAVVGIGINLQLPPGTSIPDQPQVTDLASHLGELPDRNLLLARLLVELHTLFETYATAGFPALRGAWEQRNAHADLPVTVAGEDADLRGTCAGVDEDGALLLRTDMGTVRVLSGEVSLRVDGCSC